MSNYIPTIGLEIHAELKTRTKMFCDSPNNPDEPEPNANVCPVCMAHPGTLPVINKEAVKHMVRIGTAVGGTIADFTEFDRKNYFYPDIPKGYQISQYKYPIVSGGKLAGVDVTRIHLEEDTATSTHDKGDYSLVNFNRAGVPLMELVTEPVIETAETAMQFAKELQLLLRYLGASDANMEKGEMRVEANVSVAPTDTFASAGTRGTNPGTIPLSAEATGRSAEERGSVQRDSVSSPRQSATPLGVKVEVKNLNSFRVVGQAIAYEIKRQTEVLERGEEVVQETRGWDENKGETFSQRKKEEADDYRYFPDPDLPKLKLSEISELQNIELPELPWEKRERYKQYEIGDEAIEVFIGDAGLAEIFEKTTETLGKDALKTASNYLTTDVVGLGLGIGKLTPDAFAELISMNVNGDISSRGTKDILKILVEEGGDPQNIAEEKGLFQKSDASELQGVVDEVISENTEVAEEYKNGKEKSLQFLVGQAMKKTQGAANPQMLQELFKESLKS